MLEVPVLRTLCALSDGQAECRLRDRLSFMRLVGLGLHEPVPDATTLRLSREQQLTKAGAVERLFGRSDAALRAAGFLAMGGVARAWARRPSRPARPGSRPRRRR
jgi:transposase, IS5 family